MKIGEAAKETGLSVSNIRFYEKKGLLAPRRREESQYREYGPEDVRRLKEIMLLRKLGLSVESIYLLYHNQVDLNSLIRRQKDELSEQIEQLEGALKLCGILEEEHIIEEIDVDKWLHYVYEEEQRGQRFAQAEEWLEDLSEFTCMSSLRYDPYAGKLFQHRWVTRTLAVLIFLFFLLKTLSIWMKFDANFAKPSFWFWTILTAGYALQFLYFHWKRHKRGREEEK